MPQGYAPVGSSLFLMHCPYRLLTLFLDVWHHVQLPSSPKGVATGARNHLALAFTAFMSAVFIGLGFIVASSLHTDAYLLASKPPPTPTGRFDSFFFSSNQPSIHLTYFLSLQHPHQVCIVVENPPAPHPNTTLHHPTTTTTTILPTDSHPK